jgi:hypothetical protein
MKMNEKTVETIAKREAKGEVKSHEKRMHGMKAGGPTSLDRKTMWRNMSRVNNQRSR